MIRVVLPHHLRNLAGVSGEVALQVEAPVTQRAVLDALEAAYPTLPFTRLDTAAGNEFVFLLRATDLPEPIA